MSSMWLLLAVWPLFSEALEQHQKLSPAIVPFKVAEVHKFSIGANATIICPQKFKPIQINWFTLSRAPLPYHMKNDKGKLRICGVKEADAGYYMCEANPGDWQHAVDFWVELKVIRGGGLTKNPCDRHICRWGEKCVSMGSRAMCVPIGVGRFTTESPNTYPSNFCNDNCENGGTCVKMDSEFLCHCRKGFMGSDCRETDELTSSAAFDGEAYVEFPRKLLLQHGPEANLMINMTITTAAPYGLLLWVGSQTEEYLGLLVTDGHLELIVCLGRDPVQRRYEKKINDNRPHNVTVLLKNGAAVLMVDDFSSGRQGCAADHQSGVLQYLNTKRNIFVGGVRSWHTVGIQQHQRGFNGCIRHFSLNNKPRLDFTAAILKVGDLRRCP